MEGKISVQFIVAWQAYRVGDIIKPPGTLRQWLIESGYAKAIDTGSVAAPLTREAGKTKGGVRAAAKRLFS